MPKKLSTVLGIDVGSQQIKIAEVKMQGREPAITALGIAATPAGAVDHTGVYDYDSVGAVLKDLIHSSGSSAPNAVISIAGQASVLVRTLEVPKMSDSELKEHMNWEISRNVPFAESTVVSDFRAFPSSDPNASNMDVVMAIAPQSAVDTMVTVIQKAGKKPYAIDVEPLGLARSESVSYGNDYAGKSVCVVDIGHNSTSINIYRDGQLLMPRQIPIGGYQFTKALADNLSLTEDDAEQVKFDKLVITESAGTGSFSDPFASATTTFDPFASDPMFAAPAPEPPSTTTDFAPYSADPMAAMSPDPYGVPDLAPVAEPEPVAEPIAITPAPVEDAESLRYYNAVAGVLDEFSSELRRSIDYFRSKGGDVDVILLAGGGAKVHGFSSFIQRTMGVTTENYDPTRGINMIAKRLEPGLLERHKQEFAIAVGNALHIAFD